MKEKRCKICGQLYVPECSSNIICKRQHYAKCPICGTEFLWNSTREIPPCSKECRKELTKRKNIEKYGVAHPMQCKEVQAHHRAAMKAKYGVESPLQSEEIRQRAIQTNIERFGAEWALGSKEMHDRIKETMKEKYGGATTLESEILRKKVEKTCLEKYGVDNVGKSEEVRKRTTNTNFLKYGFANPAQNKEVRKKITSSRIEKYGTYWSSEIRQKTVETNLKNYGVDNPSKSQEIKDKIVRVLTEKYGENYGSYCLRNVKHGVISNINKSFAKLLEDVGLNCEFEFMDVGKYRYDIVIPEMKILIEIDPTYTHNAIGNHWTDKGLDIDYHRRKSSAATDAGYRCIHVFDWDDWNKIVDMLRPRKPIHANKCMMYKLNKDVAYHFLDMHHLKGAPADESSLSVGLAYNNELIQVMTFTLARKNTNYDIELSRFCCKTGVAVTGGSQKLFKFATKGLGLDNIFAICDLSKFQGNVYNKLGMDLVQVTDPQEIWSKNDNKIIVDENVDRTILVEQGWLPVYDCGKAIYEFKSHT